MNPITVERAQLNRELEAATRRAERLLVQPIPPDFDLLMEAGSNLHGLLRRYYGFLDTHRIEGVPQEVWNGEAVLGEIQAALPEKALDSDSPMYTDTRDNPVRFNPRGKRGRKSPTVPDTAARIEAVYWKTYQDARVLFPRLPVDPPDLHIDRGAQSSCRSFALFDYTDSEQLYISVAPQLLTEHGEANVRAVIAHEVGHLVDFLHPGDKGRAVLLDTVKAANGQSFARMGIPLPRSPEQLADLLGEQIIGQMICYDEGLVQTTDQCRCEFQKRPAHLG